MQVMLNIEVNRHNEDRLNHCLGAGGYINKGVRLWDHLYRLTETEPTENAADIANVIEALIEEGFTFTLHQTPE